MKKYYLSFLLPLFLSYLFAETITVSGKVLDETTQLPISNVNVFHGQEGTYSNSAGKFKLELNKESIEITFSHIGYKEISLKIEKMENIVYLKPITLQVEGVEETIRVTRLN